MVTKVTEQRLQGSQITNNTNFTEKSLIKQVAKQQKRQLRATNTSGTSSSIPPHAKWESQERREKGKETVSKK